MHKIEFIKCCTYKVVDYKELLKNLSALKIGKLCVNLDYARLEIK